MRDILEEIIAWKRQEVKIQKRELSPAELYKRVERKMDDCTTVRSMATSLIECSHGIIAEFKRKSPSKGWIHVDAEPTDVVPQYVQAGAAALSILTDEKFFGGTLQYIRTLRPLVETPILRKEFVVDEYQLFQSKDAGADAVLLIAACLELKKCATLIRTAHELKLEVLLEIHSPTELDYASLDADMLGVNNRNLGSFHTDVENSFRLAPMLPTERVKVSESGISNPQTIRQLREAGFRGFLIGESFMKEDKPGNALRRFLEAL